MSGFALKILALVAMTFDHIGYFLFPGVDWLRIIGRLAYPIFAFLCSESYRFTHDRNVYWQRLLIIGGLMEVVLQLVSPGASANIFLTLACGFLILQGLDQKQWFVAIGALVTGLGLRVDYSWYGMLMIPLWYYLRDHRVWMAPLLLIMSYLLIATSDCSVLQYYAVAAVIPILLYNGKPGYRKGKYFFYVYYPLHIAVLAILSYLW